MGGFNFNPVLSEIQSHMAAMSPGAQAAVKMANPSIPSPQETAAAGAPSVIPPGMLLPHPDAGPPQGNISMPSPIPSLAPMSTPEVKAPRGTIEGDTNARGMLLGEKPGWENLYSDVTNSRLGQAHPLVGKLLGGAAEVGGFLGNTLANAAPGIAREIPGTTQRHDLLTRQADTALTQDVTNAQKEAEANTENATAQHTNAETPTIGPLAASREGVENAQAAAIPEAEADKHALVDPTIGHLNAETAALGTPKEKNPQEQTYDSLLKQGLTPMQAYEKIREKPAGASNAGTWELEEDATGKPIEYNTKTGRTQAAPEGIQKSGTKAKADTALAPVKAALDYADDYGKRTVHTGPGDEALMEKFFELAKPSTGFRMSQPQIDMLKKAQSWMSGLEAHLRHATTGTWFSDEQRNQIVATMHDLGAAKGLTGDQPANAPQVENWVRGTDGKLVKQ